MLRQRPCCLSAVEFRPALPAPDKSLSPHPALQLRLDSLIFALYFCLTLSTAYCCPSVFRCPECLDPFALCPALPDSLGGRDSIDYYGSAAPPVALATYPPTLLQEAM